MLSAKFASRLAAASPRWSVCTLVLAQRVARRLQGGLKHFSINLQLELCLLPRSR
jgi:hypothetical protein